ncbi:9682_t:CDS:2, partial [Paraglomus occultum]
ISSKRTIDDLEREYGTRIAILEAEYKKIKYTITAAREIGEHVISEAQVDTQYILNLLSNSGNVSFEKLKLPVNFHKLRCTSESDLQVKFVKLFQSLPEQMKPWGIRDTLVEGYLKDPIGKIDFTIIQGNVVSWVHVVSLIEIKSTLNSKTSHCEALGQLIDRFTTIFDLQKNRSFIIGAICGDSQVEFVWQNREKNIKRSDLLDLSFTSQTIGMNMLLNMVTASQMQLGYSPPEDYKAAVSSVCDVDHEIKILHHLRECDFIPKVITFGNLPENKK